MSDLPWEEEDPLLGLDAHHQHQRDQQAQEGDDQDARHHGQAPLHALHHHAVQLRHLRRRV